MVSVETKIGNLVSALFCKDCYLVDILKEKVICNRSNCQCNEQFEFNSLIDFYANLYFHMDNVNLANYETLVLFGALQEDKDNRIEINALWDQHLSKNFYDNNEHELINVESVELVKNHLEKSRSKEELLIRCMNWLYTLDTYLERLRNHLEIQKDPNTSRTICTKRGIIVFKRKLGLNDYLRRDQQLIPPVDPNYISLRNNIHHFFLAKENYPYYDVTYLSLLSGTAERLNRDNICNLKIGFFPGNYNFEDYGWRYDDTLEGEDTDEIYFQFTGVADQDKYYADVIQKLKEMLGENPDIIIFPELFAPEDLQTQIMNTVKEEKRARQLNGQPFNTFLLLPGSFHLSDANGRIYNRSSVSNGNGQLLLTVNKMNKFKITKNNKYSGALDKFVNHDGVEKCAFDQREIQLIETPIGRIGIFICVDLLNFNIEEVIVDRHVDLVFVMTMTPRPASGKFLRRMQELGERNHSTIIICNNLGTTEVSEEDEKNGAYRIVTYFPGLRDPYRSNNVFEVRSIEEMIQMKKNTSIV